MLALTQELKKLTELTLLGHGMPAGGLRV